MAVILSGTGEAGNYLKFWNLQISLFKILAGVEKPDKGKTKILWDLEHS